MPDPLTLALAAALGLAAGLVSGLFGVGGGIVMVPAAVFLLGATFHVAKAASLLVITLVTALGIWEHRKEQHVNLLLGALLGAGGVGGSLFAVYMAEGLGEGALRFLFGLVLVAAGLRLWFEVKALRHAGWAQWMLAPLIGFAAGLLAGLFGIGGGVLMVPAMVLLGVPMHTAVGTSLVAVLTNSAVGTAGHLQLGYGGSIAELGLPLAAGAAVGITAGARLASRTQARSLRRAFGAFLAAVGLFMALTSG